MSEEEPKKWKRYYEVLGKFAENKYNFTEHLQNPGDYVETYPLEWKDQKRIIDAASAWSWEHQYTVKCQRVKRPDGTCVRVMLINKHKVRDYS